MQDGMAESLCQLVLSFCSTTISCTGKFYSDCVSSRILLQESKSANSILLVFFIVQVQFSDLVLGRYSYSLHRQPSSILVMIESSALKLVPFNILSLQSFNNMSAFIVFSYPYSLFR